MKISGHELELAKSANFQVCYCCYSRLCLYLRAQWDNKGHGAWSCKHSFTVRSSGKSGDSSGRKIHPGHQMCKEAAVPVPFQLAAHSMRVWKTKARPCVDAKLQASHPAAGLQHGVTSLCGILQCAGDSKGLQRGQGWWLQLDKVLLCESLSLALWHSSVIMAARIHHCHVESRDGSGLRSVSAFPFDTIAVSLWPRLSPQD